MRFDRRIMALGTAVLLGSTAAAWADDAKPADSSQPAAVTPAASTPAAPAPAAAAPATLAAPAAPAPTAPVTPLATVPQVVQDWAKFCDPDPKDGHKICIVRKLVFQKTSIVGSFVLRVDSAKGVPTLAVAALPVGILLKPGLKWQVDKGKPQVLPFWRCTPQSCESEQLIKADFVKRLRNGKTLTLAAKNVDGKDFSISVDLKGFGTAFDNQNAPTYAQYQATLPK